MRAVEGGEQTCLSEVRGIKDGVSRPNRAAMQDSVRKSKIERPCAFKEQLTVNIRATNLLPSDD
jgi:hypothetical protein